MPVKRRFGIVVNIQPTVVRVLIGGTCPIHNKPINFITELEGEEPANACIDCIIELLTDLSGVADEHNVTRAGDSS